ncbi:TetR/AcrR family transcriptional regulator [Bacillus massiliigorillae]|uniref:TetR/AcrR family transcriptional regulator n=1 Tax=Bacillus massiliigorillae TaxID=1243664 RepID=UPI00039F83BF|nr:TetR/AcrR family transcriptional regulator [Bacillus massiliigorillae]
MSKTNDGLTTKLKIAKIAEELFSQKGYAATSMEDITTASGSSKGSIYYHFKSKEKLFMFIVETAANEWKEEWAKIEVNCKTNTEKLYAISEHYVKDFQNPIFSAMEEYGNSQVVNEEATAELLNIIRNQYFETYENILKDGIAAGEFIDENPRELMYMLFALHNGLGVAYYEMDFDDLKELYRKSTDFLLRGLAKR